MHNLIATTALSITELLAIIVLAIVIYAIPIFAVIWFAKRTIENKRENVKLRLEVGKLADELAQVRKQLQPNKL
jgi:hypothetical protein